MTYTRSTIAVALALSACVAVPQLDPPSRRELSSVAGTVVAVESPTGTATETFGASFDARGIVLAIGAPDTTGGRVSVFLDDGASDGFVEEQVIEAPNVLPFGTEVAVGKEDIAITASDGVTSEVWVASANVETGELLAPVQIVPDEPVGPTFGAELAVHTKYLVVSEPPDGVATLSGRVFVFAQQDDGSWLQDGVLSEAAVTTFGSQVTIWDDCAVVSSGDATSSGAVFAYIRTEEGEWVLDGTLLPDELADSDGFGASIAANDKDIFIGAPGDDEYGDDAGKIYFYVHRSDGWAINYAFGLQNPVGGEQLGASLAIDRQFLLAGTPGSDLGSENAGSAQLFWWYQNAGKLGVVDQLFAVPTSPDDGIGEHVALADGLAVFGNRGLPQLWQGRYQRPPIGRSDEYSIAAAKPYESERSVLENDEELDEDPMTARLDETTANGTLELSEDGTFTYTPNPTFQGTDTFYYYANDGKFDSKRTEVDIIVEAPQDELCGDILCPPGSICYADACFASCDTNDACRGTQQCFVGRCATDACSNVDCPTGQVCYGGSCFASCNAGECSAGTQCFEGRCAPDPCSQVQCPLDHVCHGGACFRECEADSQCGDSACWDGRCTSDPCDGIQCTDDEVCIGGSCFLGCTEDSQCGTRQCIDGRCANNACEGISCRIGEACHDGGCVRACTTTADCSGDDTCQSGKCLPPQVEEASGCSTANGVASPWFLLLAFLAARRRR